MRQWILLLGGLATWAVHFFGLYAIGSIYPGQAFARTLAILVTLPALGLELLILRSLWPELKAKPTRQPVLLAQGSALAAILSLVAILWQALPAILL